MLENLDNLINKLWDLIEQGKDSVTYKRNYIKYDKDSKERFKNSFEKLYIFIAQNYMKDSAEPLDRHKVSAITIVAMLNAKIFSCKKINADETFFGNYTLATDVALIYMLSEMNKRLKEKGQKEVGGYIFPQAMSCATEYYIIFYRNLYYAHNNKEWNLNPLDIAERLFLLEYITLEKNGIDPSILNEY